MHESGIALAQHILRLRVYYEDTDAGGIVYYANYLKFFERCRTELLRAHGIDQSAWLDQGVGFVVRRAEVDYRASARLDDTLIVTAQVERLGAASAWFAQRAMRDEVCLAAARVQVACIDIRTARPRPLPDALHAALRGAATESF